MGTTAGSAIMTGATTTGAITSAGIMIGVTATTAGTDSLAVAAARRMCVSCLACKRGDVSHNAGADFSVLLDQPRASHPGARRACTLEWEGAVARSRLLVGCAIASRL